MNCRIQFVLLLLVSFALKSAAQGTAFNYQGRLNDTGAPANASYDFRFAVFNAVTNGSQVSVPLTNSAVGVSNGLFTVTLDFGAGVFNGSNCWLDIGVRAAGVTNFTPLIPRQPVLPVPYAIFATGASNLLGPLAATQLSGTIPSAQIAGTYSGQVNFANGGNTFSGTFTGSGAALTGLNGSQVTNGTVADARLSANVALLNASQTFTGNNQFNGANNFTNLANNFTGSFFGNGLVGWVPVSGSSVQAEMDHGYLLTSPLFTTVTLPADTNIGYIVRISGAGSGGWRAVANTNQSFIGNFSSFRSSLWLLAATGTGGKWQSLAASANGTLMYAASGSGIFASTDAGQTWGGPVGALSGSWNAVATAADGNTVFAVANNKAIQVSGNGGIFWTPLATATASNCLDIACSADGTKAIASVRNGKVYTNDASGAWFPIGVAAGNWIVAYSGNGNLYAAASNNGVVYTSASGSVMLAGNPKLTALVCSTDGTKLAACASPGRIYTSSNSGVSWNTNNVPLTDWSCLAASADCTRLVAGVSNGVIYASPDFGTTWSALAGSTNQVWSALASSADGSKLAGASNPGTGGNIYYSSVSAQFTTSTNSFITGSQGSAVELQYIGNNQFMPVSSVGAPWAN